MGYPRLFCLMAMVFGTPALTVAQRWTIKEDRCHDVKVIARGSVIEVETTGKDPYLIGSIDDTAASAAQLVMECFAPASIEGLQIFVGPPFNKQNQSALPAIPASQTWTKYTAELSKQLVERIDQGATGIRLDFGKAAGVRFQLRNIRIITNKTESLVPQAAEAWTPHEKDRRAKILSGYLRASFPTQISQVKITEKNVLVVGKKLPARVARRRLELRELAPWQSIADTQPGTPIDTQLSKRKGAWFVELPRRVDGRDRFHSGWQLFADGTPVSARRFATSIEGVEQAGTTSAVVPRNQKGLGGLVKGGPLQDVVDLGVSAVTLNVGLSGFVVRQGGPGRMRIPRTNPRLFFNQRAFRYYDQVVKWAQENKIVVSAILLVGSPKNDSGDFPSLAHPQSDGGKYAMPNLQTEQGATIYAFVLDRLAKRYGGGKGSVGIIANWIAHNEVDQHYVWTNMGEQPRPIIAETYYRSMRMISASTRRYNQQARVFASLTHHWLYDDKTELQKFAPRHFLVALQRYSIHEGDFPWGIAYHPYPVSLFAPVAWNDKRVTGDFDTPYITMQNIEVLDAFAKNKFMRNSAKLPRPILLSEQGYHTISYQPADQANQAGSILFAMNKIANLPNIESFHYHRWIDHPKRAGCEWG